MRLKKRQFKLSLPQGEINVVSLMDILTVLLFFLLIVASFTRLSIVEGDGVVPSSAAVASDNSPQFALEVIFNNPTTATVWIGPVNGLKVLSPQDFERFLQSQFQGNESAGFLRKITAADPPGLFKEIQQTLIPIKRSFPGQSTVVAAMSDLIPYQEMIDAISAIRSLASKADEFELTDLLGNRQRTTVLFPQVIISEWSEPKGA